MSGERLAELLTELADLRAANAHRVQHFARVLPDASRRLEQIPLLHGIRNTQDLEDVVRNGLRSRTQRGDGPSEPEQRLGIVDVVYTAAGLLYPQKQAALIFSHRAEGAAEVSASPWDSGAFCRSLCPHLPPAATDGRRRELFARYSLSAPDYRTYLVQYVSSCFGSAEDYLGSRAHRYPDPLGALDAARWTSRIFEVRFQTRLALTPETLLAIFLPREAASPQMERRLNRLQQAGVHIRAYNGVMSSLDKEVRRWMRTRPGAPP